MTQKRRQNNPEQIVRAIQGGEVTLAAGKSEAEVFRVREISDLRLLENNSAGRSAMKPSDYVSLR